MEFCEDYEEFEANSYTFQMLHDQLTGYRPYIQEEEEPVEERGKKVNNCFDSQGVMYKIML